jgi:hypothetical protein
MAATNYTYMDLGGCNCPGTCVPCELPFGSNLSVTANKAGTVYSGTLTYSGTGGTTGGPAWTISCLATGASPQGAAGIQLGCYPVGGGSCTYLILDIYANSACEAFVTGSSWNSPLCPGTGSITLASYTCSPLNLVWTVTLGGTAWTITITP